MFKELQVPRGQKAVQEQMATRGRWDQRATLGLMDLRDTKAIRDLKAKKDLLVPMVYQVYQVYRDLQAYWDTQAAMEPMEKMDLVVFLELLVLTASRVDQVCLDLRVNLIKPLIQYEGHLGHLGETEIREIPVHLESLAIQGMLDEADLSGFLVVKGLQDLRVKEALVVSKDLVDQRGDKAHKDHRGHQVGLGSFPQEVMY